MYHCSLFRDIRSIDTDPERVNSFQLRAESYYQLFVLNAGTMSLSSLPYLHILRNHTADQMKLHFNLFGWGYGMYCCNAGEHLNKVIKTYESTETNFDKNRFFTIVHLLRSKQFIFTDCILSTGNRLMTCTACNQPGHNRKNKSCPMHPSHPVITFDESDEES